MASQRKNRDLTAQLKEHIEVFDYLDAKMGSDLKLADFRGTWLEEFAREKARVGPPTLDGVEEMGSRTEGDGDCRDDSREITGEV